MTGSVVPEVARTRSDDHPLTAWPRVKLGDVLATLVGRATPVDGSAEYALLGARWYAKGLYVKDRKPGSAIKANTLFRVAEGDFVYNRLFAWKGSFAVATSEHTGCYVSNEFPCFKVDEDRLDPRFLWLYFSQERVWNEALSSSFGATPTSRNRLKETKLLAMTLPLPPLLEQRRIVARLDALSAKTEEAHALRALSAREIDLLTHAESRRVFASLDSYPSRPLSQVCRGIIDCLHSNPVYSEAGIPTLRSPDVGWGVLYLDRARTTDEREYQRRVGRGEPRAGDLVVVREGGGTGRAGLAEPNQRFSLGQRVMLLRPAPEIVDPRFLLQQWLSPRIQDDHIAPLTKGSASPHLNISSIREFPIVTPPLELQRLVVRRLDAFRAAAGKAASVHVRIAAELDALLPAVLDRAFKGEL